MAGPGFGRRDIDRQMKMEAGFIPKSEAAGGITGPAINRRDATNGGASVVLHLSVGAATGAPSTQTVQGFLEDSDDGSGGWSGIGGITTALTADDANTSGPNVNLVNVKKFIRGAATVGFTGGSSPEIIVAITLCIGGRE